ncbi:LOW QUALITY PROTEIN: cytosolic carboxypeptidase 3 [Marmota marmota marmota]|uniref:LOW QUALITY PROTEIN: cytosolic carboxypeptidase 3 n=1 Tax=Marmota marmota marmota TaxID=9994 RepID=UPI002093CE61|nr:LOW QUALITY PROTEIN: cytosolic carboxypeptidase 3 [Marmota marmota marmota]
MSEDSEKEDYSDRTVSDEDELDEETFMKFVSEDIRQCTLLTANSFGDPFFPRTTQILLEYQLGRWVPRLREPRDLYGVSSSGPLSPTLWPYHCEVIDEKVQHIDWTPFYPEPVYIPTGLEMEPLYSSSKEDTVVYLAEDAYKEPCFVYSRVGGNRTPLKPSVDTCDNTLMFEARFESGNLQKVVKVAEYEYQLTVRPDLFTNKHTQWYYFQVSNTQAETVYRFTIVNFTKPTSLYNRGMRPLFYSEKEAKAHNVGWQRIGDQIRYYKNNLGQEGRHFFSLTWTFQFPHNKDTCYFAHCYPYLTGINMTQYGINNDPVRSKFCKTRVLCHTLARNMVYVLTITTPLKNSDSRKRKAVILTARVHPGETNSSWIMKGFLDYILGDSSDAQLLRDTFIFKVVPMLNPDGVIVGNYRCSLAGRDLNRNYTSLLKDSFPSVWYTRNMIHRLMEKREVILYCDLHGHSRKENIFMYGCDGSDRTKALYLQQRIFPFMLSKNCPDKVSIFKILIFILLNIARVGQSNEKSYSVTCFSSRGSDSSESNDSQTYLLKVTSQIKTKKKCLKTKKERNSTMASYQSAREEVYGREHVLQKHKESNSDVKVKIPGQAPSWLLKKYLSSQNMIQSFSRDNRRYFLETCERPIQEIIQPLGNRLYENCFRVTSLKFPRSQQTSSWIEKTRIRTDLHHNLKSKGKECTPVQSKKSGINWTDDEKRIYRDKRIAQTQEILHYLLPIMETQKPMENSQIKQLFNSRSNFQIQHQPKPATCINIKKYNSSWTPPRNPPFVTQRNLRTDASEWFQSVPQRSLESLTPLKGTKKRKKHVLWATKTEDMNLLSSKWETAPSSFEVVANIKDKSLQDEESKLQSSKQIVPHLPKTKKEQPHQNDRQLTFHLRFQRDN